jgi:hypothetical protein
MPEYLISVQEVLPDVFDWVIRDESGRKLAGGSSDHPDLSRALAERALKKLASLEPDRCDICNSLQLRPGICRKCHRDEHLEGKEWPD